MVVTGRSVGSAILLASTFSSDSDVLMNDSAVSLLPGIDCRFMVWENNRPPYLPVYWDTSVAAVDKHLVLPLVVDEGGGV